TPCSSNSRAACSRSSRLAMLKLRWPRPTRSGSNRSPSGAIGRSPSSRSPRIMTTPPNRMRNVSASDGSAGGGDSTATWKPRRRLTEHHAFHEDFRHVHHVSPSACYRDRPCPAAEFIARPPASLLTEGRLAVLLRMAGQPARMVGGEWLLRICFPSGLQASV